MFYEQRFGDDGSSTTRSEQAGNRYDKVYEKNGEMTYHRFIVTKTLQLTRLGNLTNLCQELGIRTQHPHSSSFITTSYSSTT
jgi:hypothetical protein